jgi:hypothetical protein
VILVLLGSCSPDGSAGGAVAGADGLIDGDDARDPADLMGVDAAAALVEGLALALSLTPARPWDANAAALEQAEAGCPDIYVEAAGDTGGEPATEWADECATTAGVAWRGGMAWTTDITTSDDPETTAAYSVSASRRLEGDALVTAPSGVLLGFYGSASDDLTLEVDRAGTEWNWNAGVEAEARGSLLATDAAPDGWRADLALAAVSNAQQRSVEVSGTAWLGEPTIAAAFDGLSLDLRAQLTESPGTCLLEPYGQMSLRDANGHWYDAVFLTNLEGEEDAACDGCGLLFGDGVEMGTVCPDFSAAWDAVAPPDPSEFVLSLRSLETP